MHSKQFQPDRPRVLSEKQRLTEKEGEKVYLYVTLSTGITIQGKVSCSKEKSELLKALNSSEHKYISLMAMNDTEIHINTDFIAYLEFTDRPLPV